MWLQAYWPVKAASCSAASIQNLTIWSIVNLVAINPCYFTMAYIQFFIVHVWAISKCLLHFLLLMSHEPTGFDKWLYKSFNVHLFCIIKAFKKISIDVFVVDPGRLFFNHNRDPFHYWSISSQLKCFWKLYLLEIWFWWFNHVTILYSWAFMIYEMVAWFHYFFWVRVMCFYKMWLKCL